MQFQAQAGAAGKNTLGAANWRIIFNMEGRWGQHSSTLLQGAKINESLSPPTPPPPPGVRPPGYTTLVNPGTASTTYKRLVHRISSV